MDERIKKIAEDEVASRVLLLALLDQAIQTLHRIFILIVGLGALIGLIGVLLLVKK